MRAEEVTPGDHRDGAAFNPCSVRLCRTASMDVFGISDTSPNVTGQVLSRTTTFKKLLAAADENPPTLFNAVHAKKTLLEHASKSKSKAAFTPDSAPQCNAVLKVKAKVGFLYNAAYMVDQEQCALTNSGS